MASKKNAAGYFNRELSWLEFNQRVLEEGMRADNPVLECLKFLAITASNLDEFFMVRVGGLDMARKDGRRRKDPSGRTPLAQLKQIEVRARTMMQDMHGCFGEVVMPALEAGGIRHQPIGELTAEQERYLFHLYSEELYPVITPIAMEEGAGTLKPRNLSLQLIVHLESRNAEREACYAVMALDRAGERIIQLPAESGYAFVLREEVVRKYAAHWFPGYDVRESALFRMTRNADITVREDEAPDLLSGMEDVLEARKHGDAVRLEVESGISKSLLSVLAEAVSVQKERIFPVHGVVNLKDLMVLSFIEGYDELKVEPWPPQPSANIVPNEPMFDQIARSDLLLCHPYETFDPVVRFIEEAAADPDTLAIKMVLYRTSRDSAIVSALKTAAENEVNVTVLMELKARFDEQRNMEWARDLEQYGAQVIYGVKGYKTHAKICLVVRREPAGIVRYCHFGTGNYNESTSRLYGDISYMTANPALGEDASAFFNALCGYAQPREFNLISMAPVSMRDRLLELIDYETDRARKGKKAAIDVKINALVDPELISRLYEASDAGVKIRLNVRGICCLIPDGRIKVISIVDRFLEHARIFHFCHGGNSRVFIASADWMPRNLDKRLELLVPVEDPECRERLVGILETHLSDTQSSWELQPDGTYSRNTTRGANQLRSQEELYLQVCDAIDAARNFRRTRFEPHRAREDS